MVFGKGSLREFFRDESSGEGRIAPPDAAARLQAEEESRPVDVFNPTVVNRSERERLERYNMAQKDGSSLMGAGLEGAKEKKEKEDRRMMDEFYECAILGHMTPAQWLSQTRNIGGITMTNADIMNTRRKILENSGFWADWVAEQGLIKKDEKEEFTKFMARQQERDAYRMSNGGKLDSSREQHEKEDQKKFGKAEEETLKKARDGWGFNMNPIQNLKPDYLENSGAGFDNYLKSLNADTPSIGPKFAQASSGAPVIASIQHQNNNPKAPDQEETGNKGPGSSGLELS